MSDHGVVLEEGPVEPGCLPGLVGVIPLQPGEFCAVVTEFGGVVEVGVLDDALHLASVCMNRYDTVYNPLWRVHSMVLLNGQNPRVDIVGAKVGVPQSWMASEVGDV